MNLNKKSEIEKPVAQLIKRFQNNWNRYARDILNVKLDSKQQEVLYAIQTNKKISVRSGNARGKDYVAAVASVCFLNLNCPSKVINTGPTQRQVVSIMMSEIKKVYNGIERDMRIFCQGEVLSGQINMPRPDWFLLAFKAADKATEAWTGFHSPNLMVVITEASGIEQETFYAVESILTGNSKLLIVFNPNRTTGEAYKSIKDPGYVKFKLNCLDAPNVINKKTLIPGQVDYDWVYDKVQRWCIPISENQANVAEYDFQFDGRWFRPNDLFLVKIMAEFPREDESTLVPLSWIEAGIQRLIENGFVATENLKLGVDVAGMGRDMTVFCYRRGNVEKFESFAKSGHMETAGRVKNVLDANPGSIAYIDTIGEGAGVQSRLQELGVNSVGVKFSESAKDHRGNPYSDYTEQRKFVNMRAYLYWAIRDALNPQFDVQMTLPNIDELIQDLNEPRWKPRSDGSLIVEEKEEIKKRLGRSPDFGDALALTFYPEKKKAFAWTGITSETKFYSHQGLGGDEVVGVR